jgi:hypothetical protein
MITNPQYKIIALRIAKIFCGTDPICETSVKERLINKFNDDSFAYFLTNIQIGRFYEMNFTDFSVITQISKAKLRWKAHFMDIVTGNIEEYWWETEWYKVKMIDVQNLIAKKGYQIISNNELISEGNFLEKRIVYNYNKQSYGITYVPPTGGGGSGGGGGVTITPPYTPPSLPPAIIPDAPAQSGFDIKSMLENPIVLIGIGVAAYLLLIKK